MVRLINILKYVLQALGVVYNGISMEHSNIQYGYTGNNAHGVIIDYGTGVFQLLLREVIVPLYRTLKCRFHYYMLIITKYKMHIWEYNII